MILCGCFFNFLKKMDDRLRGRFRSISEKKDEEKKVKNFVVMLDITTKNNYNLLYQLRLQQTLFKLIRFLQT